MNSTNKTALALIAVVAVPVVGAAAYVWSGIYDIGADTPHWRTTHGLIESLRERSIDRRMQQVRAPDMDDQRRIALGAVNYSAMCTGCHLSPGVTDTEIRPGLYPMPPDLTQAEPEDPRRTFWVIKHGIKMTAMPAWGKTHTDEQIWDMVAFLQKLPGMTPAEYERLGGKPPEEDDDHMHAGMDHHDADTDASASTDAPRPETTSEGEMHTHADGTRERHSAKEAEAPVETEEDGLDHGH